MDNILKNDNNEIYLALKKVLTRDLFRAISNISKSKANKKLMHDLNNIICQINCYYNDPNLEYFINMVDNFVQFNFYNCIDGQFLNNVITINRDYTKFIIFQEGNDIRPRRLYEYGLMDNSVVTFVSESGLGRKLTN